MGPGPQRTLIRVAGTLAVAVGLLLVAGWLAPDLARRVVQTRRGGRAAAAADTATVDAFVAEALPAAGAARLLQQQEDANGVLHSTWQLGPRAGADAAVSSLQAAARSAGIELHAATRDLLDAEVRVYAGSHLRQEVLLVTALPAETPLPAPVNRRERPLVSIIVGGLGQRQETRIVRTEAPLSVAIAPWQPHSLALARDAAMAWQEVLIDVGSDVDDIAAARAALPFSSGLLARPGVESRAADALGEGEVLVALRELSALGPVGARVLLPWQARGRRAAELRARIRALSERDGTCALFVEAEDPALPELLTWAAEGHSHGYRLVHASELLRATDMVGMLDVDNPRARSGSDGAATGPTPAAATPSPPAKAVPASAVAPPAPDSARSSE